MTIPVKPVSGGGFVLALLCFLFPWVSVSCPGQSGRLFRFTGVQLAVGATIQEPTMFGGSSQRKVSGEPLALAALGCGVVGLGVTLAKGRGARAGGAALGAAGLLLLVLLKSKLEGDLAREAQGVLEAHWEAGFWITCVGFVAAAVVNFLAWRGTTPQRESGSP